MNPRFLRLFIYSIGNLLLEKIYHLYFHTKYYNDSLKVTPPSRSYDMNNVPLLNELEDKNIKRIELVKKFQKNIWKLDNLGQQNLDELHKFSWLSSLDIKNDKKFVQGIILEWLKNNKNFNEKTWKHNVASSRLIFWICCSHFTTRSEDMVFRSALTNNIIKQAFHLNKNLNFIHNNLDRIYVLASLILTSVTFEGSQKLFQSSIKNLSNEIKNIVDKNGFVQSKNPEDQFWVLHHLILVKEFLIFSQNTVPEFLDQQIQKVGSNYKGLVLSNDRLPLFNGAKDRNTFEFNKFLKIKNYKFDKKTTAHSYLISKTKKFEIALDANDPPSDLYSHNYQAGCLSFEFLYNGKKILSNCGSANNFGNELSYLSQSSAAHTTMTINDTSSCLFQKNSLIRHYYGNSLIQKLKVYKKDLNTEKGIISIIAGHNGYQKQYNTMYERKIIIEEEKGQISGNELVIVAKKDLAFLNFSLRFHLTPEAKVIQTQGGDILVSVDNHGWRFKSSLDVKIESGLYFGSYDKVFDTKCVLIEGTLKDKVNNINWALEKTN